MKRLIIFCLAPFLLIGCTAKKLPYVQDLIPQSQKELDAKLGEFEKQADKGIAAFISYSQSQSYDEAYLAWNRLYAQYFSLAALLYNGQNFASTPELKDETANASASLKNLFQMKLRGNEALLRAFIDNGLTASRLSPQQRWMTEQLLREYAPLFHQENGDIETAIEQLQMFEQANFSTAYSNKEPVSELKSLSVLTANIDAFPGLLSYFYGGTSPWPNRIGKIAALIEELDPEIVCLQEVWDPDLMQELIKNLSSRYSVFVYDPGNSFATMDPDKIGLSSALFIASKVPLDHIEYAHFDQSYAVVGASKKGALLTTSRINKIPFSLVATHLQFGTSELSQAIRKSELQECVDRLERSFQATGSEKGCILGDLNINAFTPEFDSLQMMERFQIPYLVSESMITLDNQTCTNYFNDLVETAYDQRDKVVPTYELLDYCLWPLDTAPIGKAEQKRISLFDVEHPTKALSDHHGLLTVFELN